MKKILLLFIILLTIPVVLADEVPTIRFEPILNMTTAINSPSTSCVDEWNRFMGSQPGEKIKQYCNAVSLRIIGLLGIISLLWFFEPLFQKKLGFEKEVKKENEYFPPEWAAILYKWVGLGLMFIAIYGLYMMR